MAQKIKLLALLLLALCMTVAAGCRTAHGFGEDMEHAGQEIQRNTQ